MFRPLQPLRKIRQRPRLALVLSLFLVVLGLGGWLAGRHLWAAHHLRSGQSALERRDFNQARDHLSLCLELWPKSGRAHFLAARAARRLHSYDEAEEHLRTCQQLEFSPAATELERLLIRAQRGDRAVEKELWTRVERDDPDSSQILEVLIQEYVRTSQLVAALRSLELFLQRQPDDIDALLGRGWVWEQFFDFQAAVADYRRAFELDPSNDRIRLRLAQTLLITGPASEALGHFEHLSEQQPENATMLFGRARCQRQLGQTEKAGQVLDALLAQNPHGADVLAERGRVALDQGKLDNAERWLRQAVALAPYDRQANYNLLQCLEQLGNQEAAGDYRAKVAQLDEDLARIHYLTRQVLKFPNDPSLRYEAGVIFLRNGEEQKGVRWLEMALQQNPAHRPAHAALAAYYLRIGSTERAAYHSRLARPNGDLADR